MRIVENFEHQVSEEPNVFIRMSDGNKLAARIWKPDTAEQHPVPAILEFIPYRKRDFTAQRDTINHPYMAGHGYACVRVDLRGSGDSDGVLTDEYLEQELQDAEEVIRWLRQQRWCSGRVGMMGISWGGFNALQVAARRPEGLEAIVTVCSSDDRYTDDVHYMGGCLLGDNLSWAATMFAYTSLPPDPDLVGERWRAMWQERLEGAGVWLKPWLLHQARDAYWKHGSICEDYQAIQIPVFAVSGWADGYSNAVFRMLENLQCPRLGLVGPWGNKYPHRGVPGPAIGFLQELIRFWDYWLKGIDTGIMDEPMLRAWLQDSVAPSSAYELRPGRWVSEPSWPSPNVEMREFRMARYSLLPGKQSVSSPPIKLRSPLTLGEFAGKWCSFSALPQLPPDQRQEDGGALIFDSEPLDETLEIFGAAEVQIEFASDQPVAQLVVRLSDVRLDRGATRVTYGLLNLTHRDGNEFPAPLEPGKRYRVRLCLNEVAHSFPKGHRLRLALSTSYWPIIWVPPSSTTLTIFGEGCRLHLPVRKSRHNEQVTFQPPEGAAPLEVEILRKREYSWRVIRDLAQDRSTHEVLRDEGKRRLGNTGTEMAVHVIERYSISGEETSSARGDARWTCELSKPHSQAAPNWNVRVVSHISLTCDRDNFYIDSDLDAYEGERRRFARSSHDAIPRKLM